MHNQHSNWFTSRILTGVATIGAGKVYNLLVVNQPLDLIKDQVEPKSPFKLFPELKKVIKKGESNSRLFLVSWGEKRVHQFPVDLDDPEEQKAVDHRVRAMIGVMHTWALYHQVADQLDYAANHKGEEHGVDVKWAIESFAMLEQQLDKFEVPAGRKLKVEYENKEDL